MRDGFEKFLVSHGAAWAVALVSVAVTKLYSKDSQTAITILRSIIASLLITFLVVESSDGASRGTLFITIALASALSDYIVESVLVMGEKIKDDPSLITKYLPWGRK